MGVTIYFRKEALMVAPGETITMSGEELRRIYIVKQVISRVITQKKAAELIGVSYRQTKRIVRRVREEGERGIIHRLRGRRGNRRISEEVKARVMALHRKKYGDFGPTLASEKLSELHGIEVSDETLRVWLRGEGKFKWQRKRKKHREWRQPKEHYGEMVQIDGSHHDWLEGRGPQLVLMAYVDDATGRAYARFYDYEGTMPGMDSFLRYVKRYGVPQSIYLDRHTTYKSTKKATIEEQLRGEESMSQFERAMKELGVKVIHAYSAQAKGRIERKFGVFQDRLIKEMRLAGVENKGEANEFLEWYLPECDERFGRVPAKEGDLHREPPSDEELLGILCIKEGRRVRNDGVVQYKSRFYQLEGVSRRVKGVIVEERIDGSVKIRKNGSYLKYHQIPPELILKAKTRRKERKIQRRPKPSKDHPWRKFRIKPCAETYAEKGDISTLARRGHF